LPGGVPEGLKVDLSLTSTRGGDGAIRNFRPFRRLVKRHAPCEQTGIPLVTRVPGHSEDWKNLVTSARWWQDAEPTHADRLRCGVCRETFAPGPEGAPAFVEERGAVLIRACPKCVPLLHLVNKPKNAD
jgi:hypothetical protein